MTSALQALSVFLPVAYLAAVFLYATHFGSQPTRRLVAARRLALSAGIALHAAVFALRARALHAFPVVEAWSTLSAVAFCLALLLVATSRRGEHPGASVVVLGVVTLMTVLALAFGPPAPQGRGADGEQAFWMLHALTSVVATAAVVLSGLHGVMYLMVFRQMRRQRFGPSVERMPSLQTLASLMRRAALAGFVLLGVGVNCGIAWAHAAGVSGFHYGDPFVLTLIVLWLHFGAVALSGRIPGFTARRASLAAAAGLSVFALVGVLTLVPHLTFHWSG